MPIQRSPPDRNSGVGRQFRRVGAEDPVRRAQATIRYSWMGPPRRSVLRSLVESTSPSSAAVEGVHSWRGSSRASPANTARSAGSSAGRWTWRRRTATSCRSMTSSMARSVSLRSMSRMSPRTRQNAGRGATGSSLDALRTCVQPSKSCLQAVDGVLGTDTLCQVWCRRPTTGTGCGRTSTWSDCGRAST